ncbi:MAG: hypothetical protein AB7G08_26405 [Hyphomicrobiaceae bacterium]
MPPHYHNGIAASPILSRICARADAIASTGRGLSAIEAADVAALLRAQALRVAAPTAEVDRLSKPAGRRRPVFDAVQRQLLDTLRASGGRLDTASVRGVAQLLGARKSTVGDVLKRLLSDRIIRKEAGVLVLVSAAGSVD